MFQGVEGHFLRQLQKLWSEFALGTENLDIPESCEHLRYIQASVRRVGIQQYQLQGPN